MYKILFFDCFAGISGDMTVASLLDLGIEPSFLIKELKKLRIDGYTLDIFKQKKNGISGIRFKVNLENVKSDLIENRNLKKIEELIDQSELNINVKKLSKKIFYNIAIAESKVHNLSIEEIHFHEVGAIDSIIDIVSVAILIDFFKVDAIYSSPIHVGSGFTECQHGQIPIPSPATMEILKGVPIYCEGIKNELTTPTGAAIIKELAIDFKNFNIGKIQKVGYGVGKRDLIIPNLLRTLIIECEKEQVSSSSSIMEVIETNVDDMNPEIFSYLMPKLFQVGAKDVYYTSIIMKKNRPGIKISVLCEMEVSKRIEDVLFNETTTFGLRKYQVIRNSIDRIQEEISTEFGNVRIKVGTYNENSKDKLQVSPEFEDCRAIAAISGRSLKSIYHEVLNKFYEKFS